MDGNPSEAVELSPAADDAEIMKRLFPLCLIMALTAGAAQTSPRATYNFNPGWKLHVGDTTNAASPQCDDSDWKPITLPHAWNEDYAFKVAINELPTGIAWYRKHFKLPADAAGKKVFLEFEGIRQGGEFYLNGKHIGRHENGVMAVGFDISDSVLPAPQENVLAVRTDNSWDYHEVGTRDRFQWNDRNFNANYGGIPKNVKLHVAGRLYQTLPLYSQLGTVGTYIYAQDFDLTNRAATIHAETQVKNETPAARTFELEVAVRDLDGTTVKQFSAGKLTLKPGETTIAKASARIAGLNFWSWGYGYLYDVATRLKADGEIVDEVHTRTGFRKTEFANGMVKLNGRAIQIKGYAQRTSNEWPALGDAVPPWLSDFSNGLMVEDNGNTVRWMHITPWKQDVESCDRVGLMEAMPAGDSESDVTGRRWEQRVELMRDAIIYNRNNPSIIFYECGNKGISEEHMAEMKAVRDQYDSHGGRAIGAREMLDSKIAEYGGEMLYINKSARIPFWAMEYSRDEGMRKFWDDFTPPFHMDGTGPGKGRDYNRNQDSHAIEDVVRWYDYWHERPGTGTRVNAGGVNIVFSDSNTHFRGEENYRRSGEVDALRIPKDGFWAHQVIWDGWVDIEHPRIAILGHWNYTPSTKKDVYVVSSAEKVELFLNGKSLGLGQQTNRFLFTFKNVAWQPGTLSAIGMTQDGKKVCEAEHQTAGPAEAIRLISMTAPDGFKADGADVALVQVEVVDRQGRRCPTNLDLIDFELTGPAEWRGGLAQGPDNYILSKSLPVECGINRVLLRSLPQPGRIVLTAKSGRLKTATLDLDSKAVSHTDGMSTYFPAAALAPRLTRGPTPETPSFKVSRIAVSIASATAGANGDFAATSFDDDERTSWANDEQRSTGWIEYKLARPATLSEVTMKLGGWRDRSYPLRISIDGREAYRGNTPRSLGYVTLPLKPVKGQVLRVELTGNASIDGSFNITEVKNQQNSATGSEKQGKGTLNIVEIECYESVGK